MWIIVLPLFSRQSLLGNAVGRVRGIYGYCFERASKIAWMIWRMSISHHGADCLRSVNHFMFREPAGIAGSRYCKLGAKVCFFAIQSKSGVDREVTRR